MATLKTNLIEPEGATTTLTVGEAGGDLVIGADSLKANLLKAKETITIFTTVETTSWTAPTGTTSVEYLVVGGGGGGGGRYGGGGGAGGFLTGSLSVTAGNNYTLTVGSGGAGGSTNGAGTAGVSSVFSSITSTAGGGGAASGGDATTGGSGGGGSGNGSGSFNTGAAGTVGQGNSGGTGITANQYPSGGGGGSSAVGGTPVNNTSDSGAGGAGTASSLTGTSVIYAGGGGAGGNTQSAGAGSGGTGGGGTGGSSGITNGTNGTVNTGGGGGGGYGNGGTSGGAGGSGIVVLKYSSPTGGNTLFSSNGSGVVSSVDSGWGGVQVLIQTQVASDSASIDFTTGIDSTYKEYVFQFINIRPESDNYDIAFQANVSGQSGFDETMTTTVVAAYNNETGTDPYLYLNANADQAQGTAYQTIARSRGNNASDSSSGELHLFNPASTTQVKNFYSTITGNRTNDYAWTNLVGGYFNTTSAIDEVSFKMKTDNIAAGTIKMYGIK